MLKVAVVETESVAKDIIFELGKIFKDYTWTFQYYNNVVEFAKADLHQQYDMLVFHEKFNTERIYNSFIKGQNRMVLFTCDNRNECTESFLFSRILYIDKHQMKDEIIRLEKTMLSWMKEQQEYLFSYNGIKLALQIHEIHYIEKENKNLIFHTDKGELYERGSMSEKVRYFEPLGFLHIHSSYLVNFKDIVKIDKDILTLRDGTELPIARSKKQYVKNYFRDFIVETPNLP